MQHIQQTNNVAHLPERLTTVSRIITADVIVTMVSGVAGARFIKTSDDIGDVTCHAHLRNKNTIYIKNRFHTMSGVSDEYSLDVIGVCAVGSCYHNILLEIQLKEVRVSDVTRLKLRQQSSRKLASISLARGL